MEQVIINDYNPEWKSEFIHEKERISNAIPDIAIQIEHIGSTSVPGLAAKPLIDMMVGVKDLSLISSVHKERLAAMGYEFVDHPEFPERRFFRKGKRRAGTHHLHLYRYGGEQWTSNLLFRDYLIDHPEEAAAYGDLKRNLQEQYPQDRVSYTKAKAPYIQQVIQKAQQAAKPKSLIQGIIFDMDNTLLQSRIDFAAMKADIFCYLHTSGIVPADLPLSVHTCATLIEYGKQSGLSDEQERVVWEIAAKHELMGMEGAGLEPDVESLLQRLHQKYTLAIVTNNSIDAANEALHKTGIHGYFDLIVGREQMSALKPSPSGFHYVLKQFPQIAPDTWLSVGDSWIDGKASTEAGIRFICYQTNLEIMTERGVTALARIENIPDLIRFI